MFAAIVSFCVVATSLFVIALVNYFCFCKTPVLEKVTITTPLQFTPHKKSKTSKVRKAKVAK